MILLIHMGGLGDICLSESTFLSLHGHFGDTIHAVGRKTVLDLFAEYFSLTYSMDRKEWLHLFSDRPSLPGRYATVVVIGKDRSGSLRERLSLTGAEVIFVDMYPDNERTHVEEYQLTRLSRYGIKPEVKEFVRRGGDRIILYPERPYRKRKWPIGHFIQLYERLKGSGKNVVLMKPPELDLSLPDAHSFEKLEEIARFFSAGGVFFSNDSGMAHFAARCGLATLTLFCDADPIVWHPKGSRYIQCDDNYPTADDLIALITS